MPQDLRGERRITLKVSSRFQDETQKNMNALLCTCTVKTRVQETTLFEDLQKEFVVLGDWQFRLRRFVYRVLISMKEI